MSAPMPQEPAAVFEVSRLARLRCRHCRHLGGSGNRNGVKAETVSRPEAGLRAIDPLLLHLPDVPSNGLSTQQRLLIGDP